MTATDTAGVGVMLDAPFNHTSYDAELAQKGVELIKPGSTTTTQIRNAEARFFSHGDLFNIANNNYCIRASGAARHRPGAGPQRLRKIRRHLRHLFRPILGARLPEQRRTTEIT